MGALDYGFDRRSRIKHVSAIAEATETCLGAGVGPLTLAFVVGQTAKNRHLLTADIELFCKQFPCELGQYFHRVQGGECIHCCGRFNRLHIDHKRPRRYCTIEQKCDVKNLQGLCNSCHSKKTGREQRIKEDLMSRPEMVAV